MHTHHSVSIAVVIPCYRVKAHIMQVLGKIGPEVEKIYVVDDGCPEQTGAYVKKQCQDIRVQVIIHEHNKGVGGAVMSGYRLAAAEGCEVMVKLDGDGQMDPAFVPALAGPVLGGQADYTKGNRFYLPEDLAGMPMVRIIGNACASFMSKLSAGYWHVFDPTNGFTAIHRKMISRLPLDKINPRYFFESDMLFRLNIMGACVIDIPMPAFYGEEESNLKLHKNLLPFMAGYLRNFVKRIFYNYYLRDFSMASIELLLGVLLFSFGVCFGLVAWGGSIAQGQAAC